MAAQCANLAAPRVTSLTPHAAGVAGNVSVANGPRFDKPCKGRWVDGFCFDLP